jgi:predicted DNA-binding transcriptional regulator AlpA
MSAARKLLESRRIGLAAELEAVDRALASIPEDEPAAPLPTAAPSDDEAWDVDRAAKFLGVSTSWLYKAAASKDVPSIKTGGRLTFDPQALREYRAANAKGSAAKIIRKPGDPR